MSSSSSPSLAPHALAIVPECGSAAMLGIPRDPGCTASAVEVAKLAARAPLGRATVCAAGSAKLSARPTLADLALPAQTLAEPRASACTPDSTRGSSSSLTVLVVAADAYGEYTPAAGSGEQAERTPRASCTLRSRLAPHANGGGCCCPIRPLLDRPDVLPGRTADQLDTLLALVEL